MPVLGPTIYPTFPIASTQTGTSYTVILSDAGQRVIRSNASPSTHTVPPNSGVAFPIGSELRVLNLGAGIVTLTPGSGVTISALPGLSLLLQQYGEAILVKTATNTWVVISLTGPVQTLTTLKKSADQTLTNNAWTAVTWDTEVIDSLGLHESVTNPSRITATETTNLRVEGIVMLLDTSSSLTNARYIAVRKNGAAGASPTNVHGVILSDKFVYMNFSVIIPVVAGDYLEVFVYQSTGSSITIFNTRNSGEMYSVCHVSKVH